MKNTRGGRGLQVIASRSARSISWGLSNWSIVLEPTRAPGWHILGKMVEDTIVDEEVYVEGGEHLSSL